MMSPTGSINTIAVVPPCTFNASPRRTVCRNPNWNLYYSPNVGASEVPDNRKISHSAKWASTHSSHFPHRVIVVRYEGAFRFALASELMHLCSPFWDQVRSSGPIFTFGTSEYAKGWQPPIRLSTCTSRPLPQNCHKNDCRQVPVRRSFEG